MAEKSGRKAMIYQLKITLLNIEPPIWRRIDVDGECSLADLHLIIQIVMGWTNSHLHEFRIADSRFGICNPDLDDWGEETLDEEGYQLERVAPFTGVEFLYEYDFGDSWKHLVKVEAIKEPESEVFHATCLAGERSCPPENAGGISGYKEFLEALGDSDHPEHSSTIDWLGGNFDPETFPIDLVNQTLAQFDSDEIGDYVETVSFTYRQGQYLAFIHYYTKVNGIPPAQADIQRYFAVTPPTVNSMLKRLEQLGFVSRVPRQPRSIRLNLDQRDLPDLE